MEGRQLETKQHGGKTIGNKTTWRKDKWKQKQTEIGDRKRPGEIAKLLKLFLGCLLQKLSVTL